MTEYFKRYRSFVASCLEDKDCDFAKLLDYHKEHIAFFQNAFPVVYILDHRPFRNDKELPIIMRVQIII